MAGIIASLIGDNKMSPIEAASAGVWIHGDTSKTFGRGLISEDLVKGLPCFKKIKKMSGILNKEPVLRVTNL